MLSSGKITLWGTGKSYKNRLAFMSFNIGKERAIFAGYMTPQEVKQIRYIIRDSKNTIIEKTGTGSRTTELYKVTKWGHDHQVDIFRNPTMFIGILRILMKK